MAVEILALVAVVTALTLFWCRRNPGTAERIYGWLERSRKTIGAVFLILVAYTFLQSGSPILQLAAVGAIAAGALYLAVEEPHKSVSLR